MMKRVLALLLSTIMILSLVACGNADDDDGKNGGNKIKNPVSKEGVFKIADMEVDLGIEDVDYYNYNQVKIIDNIIHLVVNASFYNGNTQRYITMDMDGNVLSNTTMYERIYEVYDDKEDVEVEAVPLAEVAAEAVMLPAVNVTTESMETSEEEALYEEYNNIYSYQILRDGGLVYVDVYEKYLMQTWELVETTCTLVVCDSSGENRKEITLNPDLEEGEYFYVNTIIQGEEDLVYIMCDGFYFSADLSSGAVNKIKANDVTRDIYYPVFYKDGLPVVSIWNTDYTKQTYAAIDLSTGQKVEEVIIPDNLINYEFHDGSNSGYDLVLSGNNGVYGYNFGDKDVTLLMDYINSDLATYRIRSISFTDKDHFVAVYNDIIDGKNILATFTKVAPEDVPDKEGLTLATYYTDTNVTKRVVEFNKASDKYRILIKDYSQYSTYDDYEAGITRLNNEIISGEAPDIIRVSQNLSIENYATKGMLVDFYRLIDKDETINLEDYCTNVFKAYEINGRLYELPTSFYIQTVYGKTDIFGEDTSLTWEELEAVLKQYPESVAFSEIVKEGALRNALMFSYTQLVDAETGECNFNSDDFKKILEFANTFPEEINYDELYGDEDYWMNWQTQYIEDRTLLYQRSIYSVYEAWIGGYSNFGEEATPVGFPTKEGQGSTVTATESFAISAKSDSIDGAWEFVKWFISEEAQIQEDDDRYAYWELPVLKKALEKSAECIKTKPYYLDENGDKIEYDETVYINNQEIVIEPATEEEVQKWLDFIYSVDRKGSYAYDKAMEIISEEAAAYFSGQKSVDDVAAIIQSRMDIFISEDR